MEKITFSSRGLPRETKRYLLLLMNRSNLRAMALKANVKRGQNKGDTVNNLVAANVKFDVTVHWDA